MEELYRNQHVFVTKEEDAYHIYSKELKQMVCKTLSSAKKWITMHQVQLGLYEPCYVRRTYLRYGDERYGTDETISHVFGSSDKAIKHGERVAHGKCFLFYDVIREADGEILYTRTRDGRVMDYRKKD